MPALAIGREVRKQAPSARLIYIGNSDNLEERLAKNENIDFFPVSIKPLRRGVIFPNLTVPFKALWSIFEANSILKKQRVNFVFGSGGFSSWPACAAARMFGRPYFLTDGNAYPGLVTRLLGKRAHKVFITFEETKAYFGQATTNFQTTGFPVSDLISSMNKRDARSLLKIDPNSPTILATGGSGGAKTINKTLSSIRKELISKGYNVIWQTGRHWDIEQEIDDLTPGKLLIERFLEPARMAAAIASADLAITRCGIMTLSELAVAGLPAILVPFPFSAEGHQEANARAVESAGGGKLVLDKDFTGTKALETIESLMKPETLAKMASSIRKFARPEAAQSIVRTMLETVNA